METDYLTSNSDIKAFRQYNNNLTAMGQTSKIVFSTSYANTLSWNTSYISGYVNAAYNGSIQGTPGGIAFNTKTVYGNLTTKIVLDSDGRLDVGTVIPQNT